MYPAVGLRPVEVKQQTGEVELGIALDIKQDVDGCVFDTCQSRGVSTLLMLGTTEGRERIYSISWHLLFMAPPLTKLAQALA
jgi:hypothetical protein